jgi:hypothetical protein
VQLFVRTTSTSSSERRGITDRVAAIDTLTASA